MGFWLFCTASSLLIPLVMLFFGRRFFDKAAQEHQLPLRLPHRTIHEKSADLGLCPPGVREALVSGGGCHASSEPAGYAACPGAGHRGDQDVVYSGDRGAAGSACGQHVPVERALKENFDQFGRKR